MPDITVKSIDELDGAEQGGARFLYAGKELGVSAWGMNLEVLPAGWEEYPEHDHAEDGQEEVYVVLEGSATIEADRKRFELAPGTLARVGPETTRRITPGEDGITLLAIGATPGEVYEPRS